MHKYIGEGPIQRLLGGLLWRHRFTAGQGFFDRLEEFLFEDRVQIELELSAKHLQTLIRHSRQLQPSSGDVEEDQRLRYALDELAGALEKGISRSRLT